MSSPKPDHAPPPAWGSVPMLPVVGALIAGILVSDAVGYGLARPWLVAAGVTGALVLGGLYFRSASRWPAIATTCLLLLLVFLLGGWRTQSSYPPAREDFFLAGLEADDLLAGEIMAIRPGEKTLRAEITLTALLGADSLHRPATGKLLLYLPPSQKAATLVAGDRLVFAGTPTELRPPLNPGVFDLRAYWKRQGVYHQLFLREDGDWRRVGTSATGIRATAEEWRRTWFKTFQDHLTGDRLAVAAALVLGKRDLISEEVKSAYTDTGAIHVLAVSGLHVGIVYLLLYTLLARVLRLNRTRGGRTLVAALSVVAVWTFALVSGLSPSVQRAALMFSVLALGGILRRKTYIFNTLSIAAFGMLWLNPATFFQVGFQLSFTAIIGIVLFTSYLTRLVYFGSRLLRSAWSAMAASTGAQLGTLPLSLYNFQQFPLYFLLSGTVVILSAFAGMFLGILHGLVAGLGGPTLMAELTGWLLGTVIGLQNAFIFFFGNLPGGLLKVPWFDGVAAGLLAVSIGGLAAWLRWKGRLWPVVTFLPLLVLGGWVGWSHNARQLERQSARIIVYHISRSSLMDYTQGTAAYAFGTAPTEEELPWSAGPQREQWGYQPRLTLSLLPAADTTLEAGAALQFPCLQLGGTRWLILDGEEVAPKTCDLAPTHVLVTRNFRPAAFPGLPPSASPPTVVVDGSNAFYRLEEWRAWAATAGYPLHLTADSGAYLFPQ
ncbi:ComEC/Rec2 family competence protein [Neolewinella lacunae]|uniref:ComEC family competence protein n=1 Tax=Neolewinella lacunae TaxID=1517758 RepID=A0A923PLP6_9BACT|nr:ComEC/Rec2 family competence protein [Neolewinella lacunae]MBC6996345.1 ComEC family competence protein [Neolewinella lacunae]MDN3636968.1 ComEC/Rec2 family competence protein [Neolewinella lacunae]